MKTNNPIPYTDQELSVLVEEYITQQRSEFSLKGLYSYVVYWVWKMAALLAINFNKMIKLRFIA